jgi:DNA polymerase III epsilon subunit-like protein
MARRNFVPYRNRPRVFFDVETTGLIPGFHEITELAFLHDEMGPWSVRVAPKHMDRAHERALAVSRYNEKDWAGALPIEEVWEAICVRLEDTIIIGHNVAGFDLPFIKGEARMKSLPTERISRAWEDTLGLAMTHLVPRGLRSVSLASCCEHFEISNEGQHHAYEDVLRCKAVYERITKRQQDLL